MFEIIKEKERLTVPNRHSLSVYLSNGWKLVKKTEETIKEPQATVNDEVTKKELQDQLTAKGIKFNPRDTKSALLEKLDKATPADDFDDGLLKG